MVITDAMIDEREGWLIELGFTPEQAVDLARARDGRGHLVPVHDIRRTLERGATTAQAVAIYA